MKQPLKLKVFMTLRPAHAVRQNSEYSSKFSHEARPSSRIELRLVDDVKYEQQVDDAVEDGNSSGVQTSERIGIKELGTLGIHDRPEINACCLANRDKRNTTIF